MKIATIIARILLGLVFTVFGANIFLHFIPMPEPKPSLATDFAKALMESHYMYVVGFCQVAGGLLGPVIVNILCFHIFMNHQGWQLASVVAALALFLLWRYRANFAGLVKP